MIGTKRRISKFREQQIAEILRRRHAGALLHAEDESDADEANDPSFHEPRFVFIREDKGGQLYLISNGKVRMLKTTPEIASELDKHFGSLDDRACKFDAQVLPSRYVSMRKIRVKKGSEVEEQRTVGRPTEYSAFRARLDEIVKSSDVNRKAPGWHDFIRGLREIVQNEPEPILKVNER